eukprot:g1870.t1
MGAFCSSAKSISSEEGVVRTSSASSTSAAGAASRVSSASANKGLVSGRSMTVSRSAFVPSHTERWDEVYEIVKHLGEGITGAVHLVKHKRTGELYAKKSINLSDQDPAQKKELINEINLLRVLDHPNIVHLYECFNYNDEMHLIMENLEGGELYSMLRSGEKRHEFTDDEVASICHGALSALAYCHARKIVHRDLKPQNIVFPTKGDLSDVKIIDFGMSKRGMKKTFFGRRAVQTACGTPLYVAPEIITGARYDEKIDVWAIGVLAYHMACGKHPFQGRTQDDTLDNIERHRGAQFPGRRWRNKSQLLKSFIDQLLRPKISERPSAAEALRHPFLSASNSNFMSPAVSRRVSDAGAAFKRMEEFSSYPDIKRAALMAIAHKLHSNQIADLRHAFQKIDIKNTGTIDRSEFEQLAKSLHDGGVMNGKVLDDGELNLIFDAADVDGTGEIAYAEFLAATLDTKIFLREDRLRDAFAALDTDGSNTITAENLASLLGKEYSRVQIEAMICEADVKSTGNIDFEEFLLLMRGHGDTSEGNIVAPEALGGGNAGDTQELEANAAADTASNRETEEKKDEAKSDSQAEAGGNAKEVPEQEAAEAGGNAEEVPEQEAAETEEMASNTEAKENNDEPTSESNVVVQVQ